MLETLETTPVDVLAHFSIYKTQNPNYGLITDNICVQSYELDLTEKLTAAIWST